MSYQGDYAEDYATLNFKFTSRTTAGVPFALASGAISVYKANGATQSTAGITLSADFDSVTGLNNVLIDLSADAFYAIGNDYQIVITTGTVNSVSVVGEVVATFSIENRFDEVNVTDWTATLGSNDAYPSTQLQVGALGSISGGFSQPLSGATITTGTQTLTYTATEEEDGVLHEVAPDAGNTAFYYEMDVGQSSTIISVEWLGRINSNGDTVTVEYYDWVSVGYKTVRILSGSNSSALIPETFVFPVNATGTGANIGLGRLRFSSSTSTNIVTDRARVMFAERASGITNGSTVTLAASAVNKNFIGNNWILAAGGQDASSAYFEGASVSGTCTSPSGDVHFNRCTMNTVTLGACHLSESAIADTITAGIAGNYMLSDCFSEIAGGGSPVFDFAAVGATTLHMRRYSGGIELKNMATGDTGSIEGVGQLVINANCSDGEISLRGAFKVTDNSGGAVTITYDDVAKNVQDTLTDTADMQPKIVTMEKGIIIGAAATGTLSTTVATSDLSGYTDDQLIGRIITVTSGQAEGESSDITDYANTNGTITFTAMTLAMGNADTFKIT